MYILFYKRFSFINKEFIFDGLILLMYIFCVVGLGVGFYFGARQ